MNSNQANKLYEIGQSSSNMRYLFFVLLFVLSLNPSYSQTCCSGGIPISSNIGFTNEDAGIFHLAIASDFNNLNSLFVGSDKLDNNNRRRNTNAFFFRLGYDVTPRLSFEVVLPYIIQKRAINLNNGGIDEDQTSGTGDILLLAGYQLYSTETSQIGINAGVKFANGSFSETNSSGQLLINDLQPGSGSTDFILRLNFAKSLKSKLNLSWYGTTSYQIKGINDEYLGSLKYQFGNEIQVNTGLSSKLLAFNQILSPSVGVRYRSRSRDLIDDFDLDNTGGTWLLAQFGLSWEYSPMTSLSILYDLPVYQYIDGTQLSNDYILNITFYQKLNFNKNENFKN